MVFATCCRWLALMLTLLVRDGGHTGYHACRAKQRSTLPFLFFLHVKHVCCRAWRAFPTTTTRT